MSHVFKPRPCYTTAEVATTTLEDSVTFFDYPHLVVASMISNFVFCSLTGQVGAIQLGISRALQNWEPDLRSPLRADGFLTRDSRVVERKRPGKAKARKSFQWVKR
ncbi:hypothetical protein SLA2020_250900 [Shorea laevis]